MQAAVFARYAVAFVSLAAATLALPMADQEAADAQTTVEEARTVKHFRVANPAYMSDADALSIYERIVDAMVDGYAMSENPIARAYTAWQRYNRTPYRSSQHGERYVNNYANETAAAYGRFEEAGEMPAGSIVAKDSFAVTARGDVYSGPLFLMEKMEAGFNPPSGDWRYTMIMPDGSLFGTTNGERSREVEFCAACHALVGERDHLFFLPKAYRIRFLNLD